MAAPFSPLPNPTLALPSIEAADDPERAVNALLELVGPGTLTAIHPKTGAVEAFWLDESTKAIAVGWIRTHNRRAGMNVYFHVNQTRPGTKKKASRADISELRFGAWGDVDAKAGRSREDCWAAIALLPLPPTFVIFSGGGFQPMWRLREPLQPTAENVARVEALCRRVQELTGGDSVGDSARILRVPFTTNWPNLRKEAAGRTPCPSGLVLRTDGQRHSLGELEAAFSPTITTTVVPFPAAPPPALANRAVTSTLATAQANMPARNWFDDLSAEQKNQLLRELSRHPAIVALADADKPKWLPLLFAFADAAQRGATEARAIALEWSQTSRRFQNEANFEKDWRSLKPGGCTVGTLIDAGKKAGFDFGRWQTAPTHAAATVVAETLPSSLSAIPTRMEADAALRVMNKLFVFAHDWGGQPLIAQIQQDGSVRAIDEDQLKRSLANRFVEPSSGKKPLPLSKFWLEHPNRREVDKVVFEPGRGGDGGSNVLDLWNGFVVQPAKGRWGLIARHLFDIVCNSDRACWLYLRRWLAHAIQFPGSAPGTVVVMRSDVEGAGKSLVLEIMHRIFGKHAILLNTPDELTGRFNDHLENVCFIGLNEPAFPGDHHAASKLKSMITDSMWLIEGKYRGARRIPNIAHIMLTTNREWAIPAGNKARRFLMLEVNDGRAGDHQYFNQLWYEIEHGGVQAFFHALLRIKVSPTDLRELPRTSALRQQQLQSASSVTRWAADAAACGEIAPSMSFGSRLSIGQLYGAYTMWAAGMGLRPIAKVEFGRWLIRCGLRRVAVKGVPHYDIPDAQTFAQAVFHNAGIV